MKSVDKLLKDGNFVLVYPEQSMWWNYRKPKPLKKGAYTFASRSNVPVVPCFITMNNTENLDSNGYPVQEYTIHIGKPIYPDINKKSKENVEMFMVENARVWKEIYEKVYERPLVYSTDTSLRDNA